MKSEITLPAAELKSILPGLNKVIGRSSLPVLGCVRIERNATGNITLQGTDLDDFATANLTESQPGEPETLLVPWASLSKVIKSSGPKDVLVLAPDGKKGAKLRTFAGGSPIEQKLDCVDVNEWPPIPEVTKPGILLNGNARQALQEAFGFASDDSGRMVINGACLDVSDPKAHYVVGTNGKVLFSANSFTFDLKEPLIIAKRKFLEWKGFLEDCDCELAVEAPVLKGKGAKGGWLQFKNDRWTFLTKFIEGNYPNWKNCVPPNSPATTIRLDQAAVDNLLNVIPRLPGEAEMNSPITLAAKDGKLTVVAHAGNDKPVVIPIQVTVEGKDMTATINRHYLAQGLNCGLNTISLFDPAQIKGQIPTMTCEASGKRLVIALIGATGTPPATPTQQSATTEPNERTNMPKTTVPATQPTTETSAPASAAKTVIEQVEKIKDTLKGVVSDFNDLLASLKTAEKEKKATEKEIESVRATLRTIQSVKI